VVVLVLLAPSPARSAPGTLFQPSVSRLATSAEALVAAPVFFNGKQIAVRRDVEPSGRLIRLSGTAKPVFVFWRERPGVTSTAEVRGDFWDMGRVERTDSRFSGVDFQAILETVPNNQWPGRDQVFMILNATVVDSPLPAEPTIRALALAPDTYIG